MLHVVVSTYKDFQRYWVN